MVFLRFPFQFGAQCVSFDSDMVAYWKIHQHIASYLGSLDFSLVYEGRTLLRDESIPRDSNVNVTFSLPGGKGGFGSMLRAIGAQIEKTTNREACRDLSGRRLRDINEEQRLKKWISKESEREAEKLRRRKARIERLKSKPKHDFNDFEYEKKLSEWPERVEEAVSAAMEKKSKRPASEASCSGVQKKKHLWLDEEDLSSSSGSDVDAGNSSSREFLSDCKTTEKTEPDSNPEDTSSRALGETSCSSHSSDAPLEVGSTSQRESHVSDASESCKDAETTNVVRDSENPATAQEESEKDSPSCCMPPANEAAREVAPLDVTCFESAEQLESVGPERLKRELTERGLKCGGTLGDRARRLFQVRGLQPHHYPPHLLAKKKK